MAIVLEVLSDYQLNRFIEERNKNLTDGRVCKHGLWGLCRHPNYFGELMFWVGLWIMGGAKVRSLSILGPIALTFLFNFVSVGLMESRQAKRKGIEWENYVKKVPSALVPIPRFR